MNADQLYLFRHAILRDAAYELQPPRQRALLHRIAGLLIQDLCGGEPEAEFAEAVCYHIRIARESVDSPELLDIERAGLETAIRHTTINWRHRDTLAYLERMVEIGSSDQRIRALATMGEEYLFLGELDLSITMARRAFNETTPGTEDYPRIARALGRILYFANQLDEAEQLVRETAAECRRIGDQRVLLLLLNDLASILQRRTRMDEALILYEEANQGYLALPGVPGRGNILSNIGTLYFETGHFDKAVAYYEQALETFDKDDRQQVVGITFANMGAVLRLQGDPDGAERYYHRAVEAHRETGHVGFLADVYGKLANLYSQQSRNEEALKLHLQAVASERERGRSRRLGLLLCNLGIHYTAMDQLVESERCLREALGILNGLGDERLLSAAEGGLAVNLMQAGRIEEAIPLVYSSIQRAEAAKDPVGAALGQLTLGACLRMQNKLTESGAVLRAAIERLGELRDVAGVGAGRCSLAITLYQRGDREQARKEWSAGSVGLEQANDLQSLKPLKTEWNRVRAAATL